jgi:hypothetical protein
VAAIAACETDKFIAQGGGLENGPTPEGGFARNRRFEFEDRSTHGRSVLRRLERVIEKNFC